MPSLFEPCGLVQMVGLRYGCVPVVRRTGGLADTVIDVDAKPGAGGGSSPSVGRGFLFDGTDGASLDGALDRALRMYKERPAEWEALAADALRVDNSWGGPAASYLELYKAALRG